MADELNIPTHRWYQRQNNVQFAKQDMSKQWIYASGISRLLGTTSIYAINSLDPALTLDFVDNYYRTSGTATTLADATTYTGASNGTMTDSDGLIKWKPHNLLTYSEQFDNAIWNKRAITVSANSILTLDPSGNNTAELILEDTATSDHAIGYPASVLSGDELSFTVYVKSSGRDFVSISGTSYNSPPDMWWATFSLVDGSITKHPSVTAASAESVGNGWWKLTYSYTAPYTITGSTRFGFWVGLSDDFTYPSNSTEYGKTYTGDGTSGIYVWGAHAYRSDLGGMVNNPVRGDSYVPTTSAVVYLPRVGNHVYNGSAWVNEGLLLESEARTNLFTYSQDFTNAAWSISNGANNATLVDSKFIPNSGVTGSYFMQSTTVVIGQVYTFTFRVKAAGFNFVELSGDAQSGRLGGRVVFNLLLGTVALEESGAVGKIVDVGGGVYDCSFTTTAATATNAWPFMRPRVNATTSATGDGVSGIQLYHAQFEAGSTPSSYIPTAGSTATRAAETLTVAAADMPWPTPVEVTGTELVTNGTFDTDVTGWTTTGAPTTVTWDTGQAYVVPDSQYEGIFQTQTTTIGALYAVTFTVTGIVGGVGRARVYFDNTLLTSVVINNAATVTQTVYRVATLTSSNFKIDSDNVSTPFYADNISVKEINPLSVSIQMDGQMTYADNSSGAEVRWYSWVATSSNFIAVRMTTEGSRTGQPLFYQRSSTSGQYIIGGANGAFSPDINVPFNLASRHGSTFLNGAVDGTALGGTTAPVDLVDLSATDFDIGPTFNGNIGKLRVWADDLGDTGIAEAST